MEAIAEKKAPALSPSHDFIQLAETRRNAWSVEVPVGVSLSRVLEPDYWTHCKMIKAKDRIEAIAKDGVWFADLLVVNVGQHGARLKVLNFVDLTENKPETLNAEGFKVEFAGRHKWRVVRLQDHEVVHSGEDSRESAQAWLNTHLAG